jgi:hypothetical protein
MAGRDRRRVLIERLYRQPVFGPALPVPAIPRPSPARALGPEERETVRAMAQGGWASVP